MANYTASDTDLTAVADAIRTKAGYAGQQLQFPAGFVNVVNGIETRKPETTLTATANDTYTPPTGSVYSSVTVNVPQTTVTSLSVTQNGTYTAPSGTAYSPVTVEVSGGGGSTTSVTVTKPSRMMSAMYVYYSAADGTYSRAVLSGEPGMPGSMTDDMLSGSLLVLGLTESGYKYTNCTVTGATSVEGFGKGNPSVGIYKVN